IHGIVKNGHALLIRQHTRTRQPRHAHQCVTGHFSSFHAGQRRQNRRNFFHQVVFSIARPGFQHDLHIKRRLNDQLPLYIEVHAVFQNLGRFEQGVVIDILNEEVQRTIVVATIHDQQEHYARYEQHEQPEAHAPARPGSCHAQASAAVLSSMYPRPRTVVIWISLPCSFLRRRCRTTSMASGLASLSSSNTLRKSWCFSTGVRARAISAASAACSRGVRCKTVPSSMKALLSVS